MNKMKAFTRYKYGGPEVLHLEEVDFPVLKDEHVIIKMMANSVNPADWHLLRGKPFLARLAVGLFRPKQKIVGVDFAGVVVQTGKNVNRLKVGDSVFGESTEVGVFAEYACLPENICAKMPEGVTFAEMASVPVAGLTALQAVVRHGKIKNGEHMLVNGSSGGVGHFAVQIAKNYGAEVTAICSDKNRDFVKSLGADQVIAYDKEDIHNHNGKYDLIVDTHGNLNFKDFQRMAKRGVISGFTTLGHMMKVLLQKVIHQYPLSQFTAEANLADLEHLANLVGERNIKVHISRTYSYEQLPEAIGYLETMRSIGKVAILWSEEETGK